MSEPELNDDDTLGAPVPVDCAGEYSVPQSLYEWHQPVFVVFREMVVLPPYGTGLGEAEIEPVGSGALHATQSTPVASQ